MKAQSSTYVQLQNIYKKKARDDVAEVISYIKPTASGVSPTQEEVETYCKNAAFIKLIRGGEPSMEALQSLINSELKAEFSIAPTLLPVYVALLASQTHPPQSNNHLYTTSDLMPAVKSIALNEADDQRISSALVEVARARGAELHNISSLVGGMVAQEIIKIITKQYIPIDNTCVFDGITSRSQTFRI